MGINVAEFEKDVERFEDAMIEDIVETRFKLATKAFEMLKAISPVLTGNYIYNHRVGKGTKLLEGVFEVADYQKRVEASNTFDTAMREVNRQTYGNEMILRNQVAMAGMKDPWDEVIIDNPVEYADMLEWGHSDFAPSPPGIYREVSNALLNEQVVIRERVI